MFHKDAVFFQGTTTFLSATSPFALLRRSPSTHSVYRNLIKLTMAFTASDICKIILAIILPPLGVFLERGCNADFLINILLTILGYIPGIIHALYIILKY
ncbi:hypothetical protein JMJ35_001920 [Cladonia borealis]|uniref:Plasma membrane proteolipid 3 n=3 Tax=Lecanorineae TaxID=157822 RepID=A0AA39R9E6_9LECA|nr:hypothetical protein JMJ35_001920 [Cladonia borealis]